jgi:hypothetical protein
MQYSDRGTSRSAGVAVWDRSTTIPIHDVVALLEASRQGEPAARDSASAKLEEYGRTHALGSQRIFLGSQDRNAALRISDTEGRPRIRLWVDSADVPRFEILDANGQVVQSWPGRE